MARRIRKKSLVELNFASLTNFILTPEDKKDFCLGVRLFNKEKFWEAHEAWEKEAELLAHGLINIISNHSPDKIIMGGGVMNQKQLFPMIRSNIEKAWNDYTPLVPLSNLISEPGLGLDSGIIGSISLISN